jgi:predicted RNase H-like HicB family nuclease
VKRRLAGEENQMALIPGIPGFAEVRETAEEAIDLLRRAVAALEKLAAEQERTNDLYPEVNQVALVPARNRTEL